MYQLTSAIEPPHPHSTREYLTPWTEPDRVSRATPQPPWDAHIQRLSRESELRSGEFRPIASHYAGVEGRL